MRKVEKLSYCKPNCKIDTILGYNVSSHALGGKSISAVIADVLLHRCNKPMQK